MSKGRSTLSKLERSIRDELERCGAEIRNARQNVAPPSGFWIYMEYGGRRLKLQVDAMDNFQAET